jgi:ATP-dependent Clp protease adapter protein ClpS
MDPPIRLKYLDVIAETLGRNTTLNILHMAHIEIEEVLDLQYSLREVLYRRADDMFFIYGHEDPYTPLSFPKELLRDFPDVHLEMTDNRSVDHAFCILYSEDIAAQVVTMLKKHSRLFQSTHDLPRSKL